MIYKVDKKTNTIVQTYTDVINWSNNFVEFLNQKQGTLKYRTKIYCSDTEFFTNTPPKTNE